MSDKKIWMIVLLGLLIRVVGINLFPPSLNWDEISHGFNAFSILKTGKDEWGVSWPTIFRAYGDYKLPVYIYLTAISEALFGLSALSVRLASIIAGTVGIYLTYLLSRELYQKRSIALVAALLVAIEPWSYFLSRGAFEANVSWVLTLGGVVFFLKSQRNYKLLIASVFCFGLSVWTYNSARIFVPLLSLSLIVIYKDFIVLMLRKSKKMFLFSSVLLILFFVPMFWQLTLQQGQARYENVAILDQGAINFINEQRGLSTFPSELSKIVYNKYTYFVGVFTKNWLSHFDPNFLFFKGGDQYQFNIPNFGLLFPIDIILAIGGLYFLLRKWKDKSSQLIFAWILLYPVAASLTRESPHTLRSSVFLPIPMILLSLGSVYLVDVCKDKLKINKLIPYITYGVIMIVFFASFIHNYFTDYSNNYSWAWQYGYQQAVTYANTNYYKYDQIIVTKKYGEPHEFFLFYGAQENAPWSWEPQKYINDPKLVRYEQSNWFWVDSFDKFIFVNDWQIPKNQNDRWVTEKKMVIDMNKKTLLVTSPGSYPPGWHKLTTISFLNNQPAFDILEN